MYEQVTGCGMGYFSQDDVQAICGENAGRKHGFRRIFRHCTKKIFEHLQYNNVNLNIVKPDASAVHPQTNSDFNEEKILAVQYTRARANAVNVEKLMGREDVASLNNIILRLHPVIELRLSEAGLALEFIISPDAWWDQQNLQGKLSVSRHRHEFYTRLMELQPEYCMGYWEGVHLSEMHLTGKYFQHPRILDEWLGTFHPNADWFRIGIWYDVDDESLQNEHIVDELLQQIQTIYPLYRYFVWTSENNFREFAPGVS